LCRVREEIKLLSGESDMEQMHQKMQGIQRKLDDAHAALQELGRENQNLQVEIAKMQGRKWADDSVVQTCSSCTKEFTLTIRKHHCRACYQIFCGECSSRTAAVPSCKKPARVCDNCYQELLIK
jgi:early endosome antigen 1